VFQQYVHFLFALPQLNSQKIVLRYKKYWKGTCPFASPKLCLWITKTYVVNRSEHSRAEQNGK